MQRLSVLFVCLLASLASFGNSVKISSNDGPRIVNGDPTTIDRVPYLVQLRTTKMFVFCGGTLVTPMYVISAAHCIKGTPRSNIIVVGGVNTLKDVGGIQRIVSKIHVPPSYDFSNSMAPDDIAIFRLNSPMVGNNIQPIGLCDTPLTPNTMVQVSGWGSTSLGSPTSNVINTVTMPIVDTEKCGQLYKHYAPIYGSMFCAADLEAHRDSCQGDSGGPAVVNGKLCGVVSWGRLCARPDSPGIYTSIPYMRAYIDEAMTD